MKKISRHYLQVYDWVAKKHAEWLQPKPKGSIPELGDVAGLIEVEDPASAEERFPAEALAYLDAALALLNNEKAVAHLEFSHERERMPA